MSTRSSFRTAEWGTVVWPGANLAPDTLYARVPTGTWSDNLR